METTVKGAIFDQDGLLFDTETSGQERRMDGRKTVSLPFSLDAMSRVDVFDQLHDALKGAIETGIYKAGDVLPTMKEIAGGCGVSFCTARRVIERLTREGYVNPRPRIGSVVARRDSTLWKGHVLFVYPDDDELSFYVNAFSSSLRRRLVSEGYLFTSVPASRSRDGDFSQLESVLRRKFDLAVVMYDSPYAVKLVGDTGIKIVKVFGSCDEGVAALIVGDDRDAKGKFIRHCRKAGVGSVVEATYDTPGRPTLARELAECGIACSDICVPFSKRDGLDGLVGNSLAVFLGMDTRRIPDLFLFWDDFVAQGAFTAFLHRGIRIPEDVKAVSVVNRGLGPVFVKPITRFEYDAAADGEKTAGYVLASLMPRRRPPVPHLGMKYMVGKTFPE